jgi:hypothetical protein
MTTPDAVATAPSGERAVPYHCPYCGGEDLWPHEAASGWECRECLRAFSVRLLGLVRPTSAGTEVTR